MGISFLLVALSIYLAVVYAATGKGEYGIAVGFVLFLLGLLGLTMLYRRYSRRFVITDHVIESHYGIISRNVRSVRVRDLRNINVRQSLMERILGIGNIDFSSSAGSDIEVSFQGIRGPMELKHQVQASQGNR
jgi:uncharacterized membrane protein YdbT with pleckstrin-like domain